MPHYQVHISRVYVCVCMCRQINWQLIIGNSPHSLHLHILTSIFLSLAFNSLALLLQYLLTCTATYIYIYVYVRVCAYWQSGRADGAVWACVCSCICNCVHYAVIIVQLLVSADNCEIYVKFVINVYERRRTINRLQISASTCIDCMLTIACNHRQAHTS